MPALKIVSTAVHPVKSQGVVRSIINKDLFFIFFQFLNSWLIINP